MRSYVISTDSSADLSEAYLKEHQITMISLSCILNGETYNSENPITPKQLYDNIREGAMPTTSQVNPEQAKAAFEPLLKEGKDILHLAFSSGLSGSCQSARIAAEELQDEYPERKIVVIDTLLAALGQGLLVYKAVQMKEQGASMDEVADWCEKNKDYIASYVTVDDLFHLYRGGRVSRSSAVLGSMVGIKPIIRVNEEGKLEVIGKVRGRKKSDPDNYQRFDGTDQGRREDRIYQSWGLPGGSRGHQAEADHRLRNGKCADRVCGTGYWCAYRCGGAGGICPGKFPLMIN